MGSYLLGNAVRISAIFKDAANKTLVDPATVSFTFTNPAGASTTYVYGTNSEVVKLGTGSYYVVYMPSLVGTYYYNVISTGNAAAADESFFAITSRRA